MAEGGLGRKRPVDFKHVERYPYSLIAPPTVAVAERVLQLPFWHWAHDQDNEGACEGFGNSMMMAVLNLIQRRDHKPLPIKPYAVRYDSWWLWDRAKEVDYWPDTNPGDSNGTSGEAACDILRTLGHIKVPNTLNGRSAGIQPNMAHGISANRWARSTDELRTAIQSGIPSAVGFDWYSNFDSPKKIGTEYWIGREESNWRSSGIRGGHCVCIYGASDSRQAFRLKNSWGRSYPLVWVPYSTVQKLIDDYGEVALVTDR